MCSMENLYNSTWGKWKSLKTFFGKAENNWGGGGEKNNIKLT